jgi:MFS family permease
MISNWLSATLARRNIHYGWVMVAVTFLTALISAGTVGAPGVFIVPLQKEFGWTTAEISSALASTNGLVQVHLIPMCLDFGIPQVQAASLLAAMGIFDFVGTIASGWLSDRYDNRKLLFWYYGLRGLSLLFLPFSDFTLYGLSLFAMFYGLDWIATVPPTVRLTAQRFGPERANLVFGWIFAGHQLGAGVAAFGAGLSRTVLNTYLPAFFVAGALCIVAALIVLAISRPKPVVA